MDVIIILVAGAVISALFAVVLWVIFAVTRGTVRTASRLGRRRPKVDPLFQAAARPQPPVEAAPEPVAHTPSIPVVEPRVVEDSTPPRRASDWFVRCGRCGRSRLAREVGVIRAWAKGDKHTMGFCRGCRRVRHIVIERRPTDVA